MVDSGRGHLLSRLRQHGCTPEALPATNQPSAWTHSMRSPRATKSSTPPEAMTDRRAFPARSPEVSGCGTRVRCHFGCHPDHVVATAKLGYSDTGVSRMGRAG